MSNDQVLSNWSAAAAFWGTHQAALGKMFIPVAREMCREASVPEAGPVTDYSLLDVAGGAGDVGLEIAARLGPGATIWCTDLVPEMIAIARNAATAAGATNVHCRESRAESLPFEAATFDAALCRFGIMFFSDPLQAVREALRVLKPGGRVVYGVWGTRAANPFHHVMQDVLDRYIPAPSPDPDAPGAFRYAAPGKLSAILREAGAADVRETIFRFNIDLPSFDRYFELRTEMSDTLRDKLRRMPDTERARFKEDVEEGASRYATSDGIRLPAEVLMVSGGREL